MTKPIELYYENKHRMHEIDYKIIFSGRKDRFSKELLEVIKEIEDITKANDGFTLNVCIDYGSYDEILTAINQLEKPVTKDSLKRNLW